MESAGLNRKLPFLKRAHTTIGKKKGEVSSPISLKYHCLPMIHSNIVAPPYFFCVSPVNDNEHGERQNSKCGSFPLNPVTAPTGGGVRGYYVFF